MNVSPEFARWARGFGGCDGGDPGSPQSPSIWVSGIEWGGGHTPESLSRHMLDDARHPPPGYESWRENLAHRFNWQVCKLLSALNGGSVHHYKQFAEDAAPFVDGSTGYFKMNLYPVAFRDVSHERWLGGFSQVTGLSSKGEYMQWCRGHRFPAFSRLAASCLPEIVICLGKTFRADFGAMFSIQEGQWVTEDIDQRDLSWARNEFGTLVIVLPFMLNRHGLTRNSSIQRVGERMAQLRHGQQRSGAAVQPKSA